MFLRFDVAPLAGSGWLVAAGVPTFDVDPFCREVAAGQPRLEMWTSACGKRGRRASNSSSNGPSFRPPTVPTAKSYTRSAVIRPIPSSSPASNCSAMRGSCGRRSGGLWGDDKKIGRDRKRPHGGMMAANG